MKSKLIDLTVYRERRLALSAPKQHCFQMFCEVDGFVYSTIDAAGRRTIQRSGLSLGDVKVITAGLREI